MNASTSYKVRVCIEHRDDGGLRVWSEDLPELVLSHADADKVIADIPRAMEAILSERFGASVRVQELTALPGLDDAAQDRQPPPVTVHREFAAHAA